MAQTTKEESLELKGRKSYLLKIKEMPLDVRKCGTRPLLVVYRDIRNWLGEKATYAARGNPGCEIWPHRFAELSKTGMAWGINEENGHRKVTRNEEEYRQLARRFGRYKRARTAEIADVGNIQAQSNLPDTFVGWQEVHINVLEARENAGYSAGTDGRQYPERKGSGAGKKGRGREAPNGNNTQPRSRKKATDG